MHSHQIERSAAPDLDRKSRCPWNVRRLRTTISKMCARQERPDVKKPAYGAWGSYGIFQVALDEDCVVMSSML